MKDALYRRALLHAWQMTTKHRMLLMFGLFAAPLGQMGIFELFRRIDLFSIDPAQVPLEASAFPFKPVAAALFGSLAMQGMSSVWILWLGILLLGLFSGLVFIAVSSQGALIHATAQSLLRKKEPNTSLAWHAGVKHAGRLFFLFLLRALVFGGLGLGIAWGVYAATIEPRVADLFIYLVLTVVALGVGMIVSFLTAYASGFVVVEEYGFFRSIHEAWRLFRSHWLVSFEVGALLLGASFVGVFLSLFSLLVFFFPAVFVWIWSYYTGSVEMFTSASYLATILSVMSIMMISALLTVYTTAAWTHVFMHMYRRGIASRIIRFATHS